MLYPKINSLYKREGCGACDDQKKRYVTDLEKKPRISPLIIGEYAQPCFASISRWIVDEKIDGMNIRITFTQERNDSGVVPGTAKVSFGGRTENAMLAPVLIAHLAEIFTVEKLTAQFPDSAFVCLFGEGYGGKIQSGGYYSARQKFVLFDVYCSGWWLEKDRLYEIAKDLGVACDLEIQPYQSQYWSLKDIEEYVRDKPNSIWAENSTGQTHVMEGIIARAYPQLLFRDGTPVMFKLKCKDF